MMIAFVTTSAAYCAGDGEANCYCWINFFEIAEMKTYFGDGDDDNVFFASFSEVVYCLGTSCYCS